MISDEQFKDSRSVPGDISPYPNTVAPRAPGANQAVPPKANPVRGRSQQQRSRRRSLKSPHGSHANPKHTWFDMARLVVDELKKLEGCETHSSTDFCTKSNTTPTTRKTRQPTRRFWTYSISSSTRSAMQGLGMITTRQYFYKQDGCKAIDAKDPQCICWHDEGTGRYPEGIELPTRENDLNSMARQTYLQTHKE